METAYCVAVPSLSSFAPSTTMPNRWKSNTHHDTSSQHVKDFPFKPAVGRLQEMDVGFPHCSGSPHLHPPAPIHRRFKEPDTSTAAAACQACWTAAWPIGQLPVNKIPALYQPCPAVPRPPTPLHSPIVVALCVSRSGSEQR